MRHGVDILAGGTCRTARQVRMKTLKSSDPRQVGDIRLSGRLGEGGMGTVYFGVTPDGDRVAVKMIREDLTENDGVERPVRPGDPRPRHGAGRGSRPCSRRPGRTRCRRGSPPSTSRASPSPSTSWRRAAASDKAAAVLGVMLAEGLNGHPRERPVAPGSQARQRDPRRDGPRVIDFGLAGLADRTGDITQTSGRDGNPGVHGTRAGQRTPRDLTAEVDVYALGAVLCSR